MAHFRPAVFWSGFPLASRFHAHSGWIPFMAGSVWFQFGPVFVQSGLDLDLFGTGIPAILYMDAYRQVLIAKTVCSGKLSSECISESYTLAPRDPRLILDGGGHVLHSWTQLF